jgi:hypothetical protein
MMPKIHNMSIIPFSEGDCNVLIDPSLVAWDEYHTSILKSVSNCWAAKKHNSANRSKKYIDYVEDVADRMKRNYPDSIANDKRKRTVWMSCFVALASKFEGHLALGLHFSCIINIILLGRTKQSKAAAEIVDVMMINAILPRWNFLVKTVLNGGLIIKIVKNDTYLLYWYLFITTAFDQKAFNITSVWPYAMVGNIACHIAKCICTNLLNPQSTSSLFCTDKSAMNCLVIP